MKVKIKLEDYLKNAGIGTIDKEKKARDFEKMVEDALKNAVRGRKTTENGGKTDKHDDDGGKIVENEKKTQLETDLDDMKKEYDGKKKYTFGDTTIKKFTPKPSKSDSRSIPLASSEIFSVADITLTPFFFNNALYLAES